MQLQKPPLHNPESLKNLPALPHILLKLIGACYKGPGSSGEIAKILEKGPTLCEKILSLVNSPDYGLSRNAEKIDQAIEMIGVHGVRNLGICASILEAFEEVKGDEFFNLKQFWWHSLKCATLARLIAEKSRYVQPDDAFLSGFLHDIGKLILWINFPEPYTEIAEFYKDHHTMFLAGDARVGTSHADVGAWLLDRWNLPSFVTDSVRYHHEPKGRILSALSLVQIVYAANLLSQPPLIGRDESAGLAQEIFGFTPLEVEQLLDESDIELEKTARAFGVEIEIPDGFESKFSESDEVKQKGLVREIREISHFLGALQILSDASGQDEILKFAQESLQILFGVKTVFFFLYDPGKDALIGKISAKESAFPEIEELFIPLKIEKSLFIESLHQKKPLSSFTLTPGSAPVISDEQIIRFTGKEGVLCLPMVFQGEPVGVMVVGLDEIEFIHLQKYIKMLTLFTSYVVLPLYLDRLRQSRLSEIQSERLMASSAIARKVFHEVNNPLSIIKNYLKILSLKLSGQDIVQDEIRIINEEIDRIAIILREISSFSEETISQKEPVDVNLLISDFTKIMQQSLLKNSMVTLHLDLEPSIPPVSGEKNRLKQVFINLIKNAVEAMPGGGHLSIQTRHVPDITGNAYANQDTKTGEYVKINITDDGIGMPDHIKSRLFEPFVSSKGKGHSGLGLSIVYNIIESLNGKIVCESNKDRGTSFIIKLPIVKNQKI